MDRMKHIRSSEFLPLGVLLSARQSELEQVVHQLKQLLSERLERRRSRINRLKLTDLKVKRTKQPVIVKTSNALPVRVVSPPVVIPSTDVVMNIASLRRVCLETFLVGKAPLRVGNPSDYQVMNENITSRNVLNRLALKLEKTAALVKRPIESDDEKEEESKTSRVSNLLLQLRERGNDVRERENEIMKKSGFTPKQLLNEFSSYGLRMKANHNHNTLIPDFSVSWSPSKEIVNLIDTVDRRLSTTEALAVLKQLGIEYQPRSAMGKKNLMATGLSSLLASNGLKLMGEAPPPRVTVTGTVPLATIQG